MIQLHTWFKKRIQNYSLFIHKIERENFKIKTKGFVLGEDYRFLNSGGISKWQILAWDFSLCSYNPFSKGISNQYSILSSITPIFHFVIHFWNVYWQASIPPKKSKKPASAHVPFARLKCSFMLPSKIWHRTWVSCFLSMLPRDERHIWEEEVTRMSTAYFSIYTNDYKQIPVA